MEYATNMSDLNNMSFVGYSQNRDYANDLYDLNNMRYVGYKKNNDCAIDIYDPENIKRMSKQITHLLMGVDPDNRKIIVPDKSIADMLYSCYDSYRPPTGDIYSRYNIPINHSESSFQSIINQAIELITSQVRTTMEMEENNSKLTAWTTVYGDFNEHKLRQHAPIKIRNKHPNAMQFNMNY
jgi:hypothetical protein